MSDNEDDIKGYNYRVSRVIRASIEVVSCGYSPKDGEAGAPENADHYDYRYDWDLVTEFEEVTYLGEEPEPEEPESFESEEEFREAIVGWAKAHPDAAEVNFRVAYDWYKAMQAECDRVHND